MKLKTWYTFKNDEHNYGYTLFCPLKIDSSIYGMYAICNDSGPNYGSYPTSWRETGFAFLDIPTDDAIEYFDSRGWTPPLPVDIIHHIFTDGYSQFYDKLRKGNRQIR